MKHRRATDLLLGFHGPGLWCEWKYWCRSVLAVYFVYRSHYEGPLSKRVRHLPGQSVLGWFQQGWTAAASDPYAYVEAQLGGRVYGLQTIFRAASEHALPRPRTVSQLRDALHEHLYVEGDHDYVRLDDHHLRVRTDDDEVELAYYFFDDEVVAAAPARLAYLLHESWPLPQEPESAGRFDAAVPVKVAAPAGPDEATTYAVLLTHYDGQTLARLAPLAFPGIALPELAGHLREVAAPSRWDWPVELYVLRALIAPDDDLRMALQRCNRWPGFDLGAEVWPDLPDEHDPAHRAAIQLVTTAEFTDGRRPEASLLHVSEHMAQLAMHCDETFGYQQWYLFDTTWARSHPNLAQSLLLYAHHWDPLDTWQGSLTNALPLPQQPTT